MKIRKLEENDIEQVLTIIRRNFEESNGKISF
ncbi:MAG: hypothetical protein H6Q69_2032 [Firmicutes bacterium]|nr:hypothetical protein [Bacillota bacterium]